MVVIGFIPNIYIHDIRESGLEPPLLSKHAPKARLATNYSIHVLLNSTIKKKNLTEMNNYINFINITAIVKYTLA